MLEGNSNLAQTRDKMAEAALIQLNDSYKIGVPFYASQIDAVLIAVGFTPPNSSKMERNTIRGTAIQMMERIARSEIQSGGNWAVPKMFKRGGRKRGETTYVLLDVGEFAMAEMQSIKEALPVRTRTIDRELKSLIRDYAECGDTKLMAELDYMAMRNEITSNLVMNVLASYEKEVGGMVKRMERLRLSA